MAVYRFTPKEPEIKPVDNKLEETKPDITEKAISDTEVAPEFDESEFDDNGFVKACRETILGAYDSWLGAKDGKDVPKEYTWATPVEGERPKELAERIAAKIIEDKEYVGMIDDLGGDDEFADYVEAVMRYDANTESATIAKSLEKNGLYDIEDEMIKACDSDDYLTRKESLQLVELGLIARCREYTKDPTKVDWDAPRVSDELVKVVYLPQEFVKDKCENHIDKLIWEERLHIRAMKELGGVEEYIAFVKKTLWDIISGTTSTLMGE